MDIFLFQHLCKCGIITAILLQVSEGLGVGWGGVINWEDDGMELAA